MDIAFFYLFNWQAFLFYTIKVNSTGADRKGNGWEEVKWLTEYSVIRYYY